MSSSASTTTPASTPSPASNWKRRTIAGLVCFVALWPAVQRGLVVTYHVDPWEFFGWAMYAVASERVQLGIELERDGQRERLRPDSVEFARVRALARRRAVLGRLASSESLARETLAAHPDADAVRVTTRRVALDASSAHLVATEFEERFAR